MDGLDDLCMDWEDAEKPARVSALDTQIAGGHYKDMAIQPIEFCQMNRLGYAESLAIKYICRHGKKNGKQDVEKAIHCLQLLIELEYPGGVKEMQR